LRASSAAVRGAWDFDCPDTHAAFMAAAEASGLYELVQRIEAGYCDRTPVLALIEKRTNLNRG
jgi:hypothetical protein